MSSGSNSRGISRATLSDERVMRDRLETLQQENFTLKKQLNTQSSQLRKANTTVMSMREKATLLKTHEGGLLFTYGFYLF